MNLQQFQVITEKNTRELINYLMLMIKNLKKAKL